MELYILKCFVTTEVSKSENIITSTKQLNARQLVYNWVSHKWWLENISDIHSDTFAGYVRSSREQSNHASNKSAMTFSTHKNTLPRPGNKRRRRRSTTKAGNRETSGLRLPTFKRAKTTDGS